MNPSRYGGASGANHARARRLHRFQRIRRLPSRPGCKRADDAERQGDLGLLHPSVAQANANCYRRTMRALLHELQTGEAVCSCCLKPLGRGSLSLQ